MSLLLISFSSFQNWTFGVELGALHCCQLSQLVIFLILLTRKDCPSKPHGTRETTGFAPTPTTFHTRPTAHDPRLLVTPDNLQRYYFSHIFQLSAFSYLVIF